jgi:hypothetical protein
MTLFSGSESCYFCLLAKEGPDACNIRAVVWYLNPHTLASEVVFIIGLGMESKSHPPGMAP